MSLDPVKEQCNLPTALIESGDRESQQREVVGEKKQRLVGRRIIEPNTAQRSFEAFVRLEVREDDGLIADQPRAAVDRV